MAVAAARGDAIVFDGVTYSVGGNEILRGVSLDISGGERVALLGRSGAGKTTLLRAVNALTVPTGGAVRVLGRTISEWDVLELRRHCGYVLQDGGLFPHMTCEENVRLPLRIENMPDAQQEKRARELFSMVGLEFAEFGPRRPRQLSGGQRQRVGVARALAADAPILLMDEPFGALDPLTRNEMQELMERLFREFGKTTLMVTHDLNEALRLATRIVLMDKGRVVADLPTGEFTKSTEPMVEQYLLAFRYRPAEAAHD